jgi:hypothetical protein
MIAAAGTALLHPSRTGQNAPMNAAASFLVNGMADSLSFSVISRMTGIVHGHLRGKFQKRTLR